jgi:hypothetical protein
MLLKISKFRFSYHTGWTHRFALGSTPSVKKMEWLTGRAVGVPYHLLEKGVLASRFKVFRRSCHRQRRNVTPHMAYSKKFMLKLV